MRGLAVKANLHRLGPRRAEDDLADRRRLVVDEPEPRVEPVVVEGRGPDEADLLLRREEELDPGMAPTLGEDAPNVFVVGACNFPQNAGFNPTGTVGALAYRAAEGVLKYHKSGGSLV